MQLKPIHQEEAMSSSGEGGQGMEGVGMDTLESPILTSPHLRGLHHPRLLWKCSSIGDIQLSRNNMGSSLH